MTVGRRDDLVEAAAILKRRLDGAEAQAEVLAAG
jgi:hypothetical protein